MDEGWIAPQEYGRAAAPNRFCRRALPANAPAGYRFLLPAIPSNKGIKSCVVLHEDLDARPYHIEDFRAPL